MVSLQIFFSEMTKPKRPIHSGATPLLRGCRRKNIFCQKIYDNFFSFQATEIVFTSKWGRIQTEIQIWPDQVVAASWTLVRSPKHAEKMLIQLITPTAPSTPAVDWSKWRLNCHPGINHTANFVFWWIDCPSVLLSRTTLVTGS